MSINSLFSNAIKGFRGNRFDFKEDGFDASSIDRMRQNAVKLIARSIGVPKSENVGDLMRWAEGLKKRKDGIFAFLNNPKELKNLEIQLVKEKDLLFRRSFFTDLKDVGGPEAYKEIALLEKLMNSAIENVLQSYSKYFSLVQQYGEIPLTQRIKEGRERKFGKTYENWFSMGKKQLSDFLMSQIGAPPDKVIASMQKGYGSGAYASDTERVKKDSQDLKKVLDNAESLKGALQFLLRSSNKAELSSRIGDILVSLPPGGKPKLAVNELIDIFDKARRRLVQVQNLQEEVEFLKESSTRSFTLRSAESVASVMGDLLRGGREKDIVHLVRLKVAAKKRGQIARDLYKISPVLGKTFLSAIQTGKIESFGFLQKAYAREEDLKLVRDFKSDPMEVALAVVNGSKMNRMIKKGFDPQQYFGSSNGRKSLKYLREVIIEGLLSGKHTLSKKIIEGKELHRIRKEYKKMTLSTGKENKSWLKQQIGRLMYLQLEKEKGSIQKILLNRYGKVVQNALGKNFDRLVEGTISLYYKASVRSNVQMYVMDTEERKLKYDISLADMSVNFLFKKGMKRLGIKTLDELDSKMHEELRQMATRGSRFSQALKFASWISSLEGQTRLDNLDAIRFVENLLNKYDTQIASYVKGADPEAHMSDLEYIRKLVQGEAKGPTEKKRREHRGSRREIDADKKRRTDEIKMFRLTLDLAKERSPEIYRMLKLQESTLAKEGREFNKPLAAAQRAIYQTLKMMGPMTSRDKDGKITQVPMTGSFLDKENKNLQKRLMGMIRYESKRIVGSTSDYRVAKKFAKLQMYSERYQDLRRLFQDQFSPTDPSRNSGLYQEMMREEEKRLRFQEGDSFSNIDTAEKMLRSGAEMGGKKIESYSYISKSVYMTLPQMVERANSIEELEEVERYVGEIIPPGMLKYIEKMEQGPGYVLRKSLDAEENKILRKGQELDSARVDQMLEEPKTSHFSDFMSFHKERINQKKGLLNTPGVIPEIK